MFYLLFCRSLKDAQYSPFVRLQLAKCMETFLKVNILLMSKTLDLMAGFPVLVDASIYVFSFSMSVVLMTRF